LSQPNLEGKNGPEQLAAIGETAAVFRDERVDDAAVDVRRCAAVRCEQRKEIAVDPFARRRREADLRTMYRLARKKVIGNTTQRELAVFTTRELRRRNGERVCGHVVCKH